MNEPTLRILSLGAGWQSTVLHLMAADGTLPPVDYSIFADTRWEPQGVYEHLKRLETAAGIPVLRVSKGDIRAEAIDPAHRFASIPYFIRHADGSLGMGRRQCTHEYKLAEINRELRRLLGAKPPAFRSVPKGRVAEVQVGFTIDEIGRVNDRSPRYIRLRYPLIELGMTRPDCRRWLVGRGWTSVGKSSCIGCPYLSDEEWRDMRDHRPDEWADACAFDEAIRGGGANPLPAGSSAYLHRSCVPLAQALIDVIKAAEWKRRQVDLLDVLADQKAAEFSCSPWGCRSGEAVSP